jgi:hypothetical protein
VTDLEKRILANLETGAYVARPRASKLELEAELEAARTALRHAEILLRGSACAAAWEVVRKGSERVEAFVNRKRGGQVKP